AEAAEEVTDIMDDTDSGAVDADGEDLAPADGGDAEETMTDAGDAEETMTDVGAEETMTDAGDAEETMTDAGDTEDATPDAGCVEGDPCVFSGYLPPCYQARCNTLAACIAERVPGCCLADDQCAPPDGGACATVRCLQRTCTEL